MRTRLRWLTALIAALTLLAGACGSSDDGGPAAPAATTAAPAATTAAPAATTAAPAPEEAATEADHLGDGSLGYVRVEAGEEIQIRSLNAISGDVAFLGLPNQRAVFDVVAYGGSFGKVKGRTVSMGTGLDDLCSADGGQAAAQTIVADEQVVGVIGTSCSGAAAAAAPLISEAGMVMISPSN
ncbi:MAG: ABC transporter substrate-binding protein, partial [Actinomycetota bacterium]|nr:ABC transporter substrate-binding protein [Actinomycetota bacterium]